MRTIRIEKGRRLGVVSDTHYNHRNIIAYCLRPFMTENERVAVLAGERPKLSDATLRRHDDTLIAECNRLLGPDDVLVHAGDVAWNGLTKLAEYRRRLNVGTVYVAVGNHDDESDLAAVFGGDFVFERFRLEVDGPGGLRSAVVSHYPEHTWDGSHKGVFHLYGHVHGKLDGRHAGNPG